MTLNEFEQEAYKRQFGNNSEVFVKGCVYVNERQPYTAEDMIAFSKWRIEHKFGYHHLTETELLAEWEEQGKHNEPAVC